MTQFEYDSFDAMGTRISFWVDREAGHRASSAIAAGTKMIRDIDSRLSRFKPDSELCALNANPEETVEVSTLMARFVDAAVEIAQLSDGLIDPTLIEDLEDLGYRDSLAGVTGAPLADALKQSPAAAPALADPAARWMEVSVDLDARTVSRPPGIRLDSGGCGKGLAADLVAGIVSQMLEPDTAYIIDCGGDMRLGEIDGHSPAYEIRVDPRPAAQEPIELTLRSGAIATSGIGNRIWRTADGFAHHLIDPGTGKPAWTGVASATALGPTALIAESIAKVALLSGPVAAREILAKHGGVLVEFDGTVTQLEAAGIEVYA